MKDGDKVTGEPSEPDMAKVNPTVTGFYEEVKYEFGGEAFVQEFVNVDGVLVSCDNIRPAQRRDKETVLK